MLRGWCKGSESNDESLIEREGIKRRTPMRVTEEVKCVIPSPCRMKQPPGGISQVLVLGALKWTIKEDQMLGKDDKFNFGQMELVLLVE